LTKNKFPVAFLLVLKQICIKISVITACRNSEVTIEKAIQSVLSQDFPDVEYIVIDGASTDDTLKVINQHRSGITRVISEPDDGIYDALNKGFRLASGDLIGLLHADDFFAEEDTLSRLSETIQKSDADAVYGDLQYVSKANTEKVIRHWKAGNFSRRKLHFGWMPPHPTLFMKRSLYRENGFFDSAFQIAADYDLILRNFSKPGFKAAYLPEVVCKMRVGGASNKNLKNIIRKSREDWRALGKNRFGGLYTLLFKNLRKLGQFLPKK
jgi:glycosyltransferase